MKFGANKKRIALTKGAPETHAMKLAEVLKTIIDEGDFDKEAVAKAARDAGLSEKAAEALQAVAKMKDAFADEKGFKEAVAVITKLDGAEGDDEVGKLKKKVKELEDNIANAKNKAKAPPFGSEDDEDGDEDMSEEDKKKKRAKKKAMAKSLADLPEDVRKSLAPILLEQQEQIAKAHGEKAELEKVLKAERDERIEKEWIQKAEKELSHVPGKSSKELGAMLKSLNDVSPELAESQFSVMKQASALIKKSALFQSMGTTVPGGALSAEDELDQLAKGIVAKGGEKLTYQEAYEKAMELNPEVYDRYQQEKRAMIRGNSGL